MPGPVIFLDEVDSTNSFARRHFDELADGALVTARAQTAGRGRLNRRWQSPPDLNFYGTALFKRCPSPFEATTALSLAAIDALNETAPGLAVYIKWPNDLYVGPAKLAGMLCESVTDSRNQLRGVAAGIGINLNMTPEMLAGIDQAATSVLAETQQEINPAFFAKKLAIHLNERYIIYLKKPEELFRDWKTANQLIGRPLSVSGTRGRLTGVFEDIAPTGEMLLRTADGLEKVNSGDVHIDKNCLT